MLALLLALALVPVAAPETPPPLTDADLRRIDDDIADPATLDRDLLIDARDALLRTSGARSLTLSVEAFVWQRTAPERRGEGVTILIGLRLQPEAWWDAWNGRAAVTQPRCAAPLAVDPGGWPGDTRLAARWAAAVASLDGCEAVTP